ncbi:mL40, partial [Diplonema papillatum]
MFRRTAARLAAKKQSDPDAASIKTSDEDKLFALMEEYGHGVNYYTRNHPKHVQRQLTASSMMYDRIQDDLQAARRMQEDDCNRTQQRALRVLPDVLHAAACRPTSSTTPMHMREPTMTPPIHDYTPPLVEGIDVYE